MADVSRINGYDVKDTVARAGLQEKIAEPITDGINGQVLTTDGNGGRSWQTVSVGSSDYASLSNKPQINGVTLSGNKSASDIGVQSVNISYTVPLTVAGWTSFSNVYTQTVSAIGASASDLVQVTPNPASIDDYQDNGIYCSTVGTNTLTFTAKTLPDSSVDVNVAIWTDPSNLPVNGVIQRATNTLSFTATLVANGWAETDTDIYTQTITGLTGLTSNDTPIADIDASAISSTNQEDYFELKNEWNIVDRILTGTGSVTAICYNDRVPTIDIPIIIKAVI